MTLFRQHVSVAVGRISELPAPLEHGGPSPLLGNCAANRSPNFRQLRDVPIAVIGVLLVATVACSTHLKKPLQQVHVNSSESVVCVGEEPAMLAQTPTSHSRIEVRNSYVLRTNTVTYKEGVDYLVDRQSGSIRRTPDSKIPDFRKNVLYAQEDFDHSKFPGFGNTPFFAYVTYETSRPKFWPVQATQTHLLPKSVAKLKAGGPFRIIAYGDSITAGGDVTRSDLIFWMRWADALQARHEHARIIAINGATGGDSTVQGLARLSAKVLTLRPDLVLVGFGGSSAESVGDLEWNRV